MTILADSQRARLRLLFTCLLLTLAGCQLGTGPEPGDSQEVARSEQAGSDSATMPGRRIPQRSVRPVSVGSDTGRVIDLWQRMRTGFRLQEHYDQAEVQQALEAYLPAQRLFDLITERANPFLYGIVAELEARGFPLELALVPVVESSFNPRALSPQGAAGLWQIVPATGRRFGLQQDWWYDGRFDPLASSRAAMEYLDRLNEQFAGDWLLSLAAYNTGGGNLRRALRRSDQNLDTGVDFWALPLPQETRNHVARVLALAQIVASPEEFGVELGPLANADPLTKIEIDAQVDLREIARLADIDLAFLSTLNAGYLRWATHPDSPQWIVLPREMAAEAEANLAKLDPESLLTWDYYSIQPGDTLSGIARKFNTEVAVIQRANNLNGTRIIAGDELFIPRLGESLALTEVPSVPARQAAASVPETYRVRRGDNLWSIARRFNLRSAEIARFNNLSLDSLLRPGQILDLSYSQVTR